MRGAMIVCTALTAALVLFLMGYVLINGIPNITWELLSTKPSYLTERIGILPDILNTVWSFGRSATAFVYCPCSCSGT